MKIINGHQYSKEPFEGYKYRAKIEFDIREKTYDDIESLDIYTTETSRHKVISAINEIKTSKVFDFTIIHWSSKEQDDNATKFIDEVLNSI